MGNAFSWRKAPYEMRSHPAQRHSIKRMRLCDWAAVAQRFSCGFWSHAACPVETSSDGESAESVPTEAIVWPAFRLRVGLILSVNRSGATRFAQPPERNWLQRLWIRSFRRPRGNAGAFWFTGRAFRRPAAWVAESPVAAGVSARGDPAAALSVPKPNLGVRRQPPRLLSPHRRQPSRTLALSG